MAGVASSKVEIRGRWGFRTPQVQALEALKLLQMARPQAEVRFVPNRPDSASFEALGFDYSACPPCFDLAEL